MRKLLREFFVIPKHGKICEKAMLTRLAMTVAITIFCLGAMGITAYAYFSYNVTSKNNVIKAATFETDINIQITDKNGEAVAVTKGNDKSRSAALKGNTTYFVTIKPTAESRAKTGFVIVTAEGCSYTYHTQQLGVDGNITRSQITFSLVLSADAKVTFLPHWGTSSLYEVQNSVQYIVQGEKTIEITVNGATLSDVQENDTEDTNDPESVTPPSESAVPENTVPSITEPTKSEETESELPVTDELEEDLSNEEPRPVETTTSEKTTEANAE